VILSTVAIAGTYKQPIYVNPAPQAINNIPEKEKYIFVLLLENCNSCMEYHKAEIHKICI
jgi:hypothetical protein